MITVPARDKQFARITAWLVANGYRLHSRNTALSSTKKVVLILERKR